MTSMFIALVLCLVVLSNGRILLYDTENITSSSEKFDCIYVRNIVNPQYGASSAGKIPYCRRDVFTKNITQLNNKCENGGQMKYFVTLLKENIRPSEVLNWNSSVEMADNYAAIYYSNYSTTELDDKENFVCHCTQSNTFGKYCEYKLTHDANSFEGSHSLQALVRPNYIYHSQKYEDIVCYRTLTCDSGVLCLDWRDICDGHQQCENGWDEENCDKLEFNECDDDEFRCTNGMCVPEEYWLDGDRDCMDWSEENFVDSVYCFETPISIDCDEHMCLTNQWSCRDGQCIPWLGRLFFLDSFSDYTLYISCRNWHNANYLCELYPYTYAWTGENGLCWLLSDRYDDLRLNMDNPALSKDEKCVYLIRCYLSNGFELDCPCNFHNCSFSFPTVCKVNTAYEYPSGSIFRSYIRIFYKWPGSFQDTFQLEFNVSGNVRCRGYHGSLKSPMKIEDAMVVVVSPRPDDVLCSATTIIRNNSSPMKYNSDCGRDLVTFNGYPYAVYDVCENRTQCMSQYRINDGIKDCANDEDENVFLGNKDLCSRVRRHRFQCSIEQPTCLTLAGFGYGKRCSNNYDTYLFGISRRIGELICQKSDLDHCRILREYIQNSSRVSNDSAYSYSQMRQSGYQSENQIPFRSYCDSFWNLKGHIDELPRHCRNWICQRDQYQCQTGQCIPVAWVCDGQWDCADASDEEAMLPIRQWSLHNQKIQDLDESQLKCRRRYSKLPFSEFCKVETEFPCLQSNVSNILDFELNPPCILYTQIGDEIEDCYDAYDEKNTFEQFASDMWGFSVRCQNGIMSYYIACKESGECPMTCFYRHHQLLNCSKSTDAVCIDDDRCVPNGRCNGERDCPFGEDEYSCGSNDIAEQIVYRHKKTQMKDSHTVFDQQIYPLSQSTSKMLTISPQLVLSTSLRMRRAVQNSHEKYSFWCNKGVSAIMLNETVCFCPPAYFDHKCKFFSDRITIITHLDLTTWPSLSRTNPIWSMNMPALFKIKVNFFFSDIVIDHYEFHSNPTFEIRNYIKHKFYLLYSRSSEMVSHKKARFYNRTDIENNHPYSVHFDIYALHSNQSSPSLLGSWRYPIYFDFLPAFRLATVLRFPYWFGKSHLDPCTNYTCNQNAICKPIFNQNNSYFCSCENGFYGKNCSRYEKICHSYCSPNSLCRPDHRSIVPNTNNPVCICPLGHFGPRCYLKFEQCNANPCLNNGSCVYTYESYGDDSFRCVCSKFFYGDRCENAKIAIQVRLNTSTIDKSPHASTIQFYDVDNVTLELILRHQQITEGLPSLIYYAHDHNIVPVLGVLKTHDNSDQPNYFIIYLQPNTSTINISSSSPEHCPIASSLLNKSDLSVPDVFEYHHICRNDSERLCFYDNNYLCICQEDHYRVDCFMHNTRIDHCTKCLSNGKCIKGDIHDDNDFICLCPQCHQGRLCEFNMQAFGFTLESLLVDQLKEVKIVCLSMVILLFSVGFFNNLCSFVTFKRPAPRKFGVGYYLFVITCLNQMSLLCLLIKFIQITFSIANIESCKTVSYLFSVFTRSTYWLTSWVTIDRLFLILFPISTTLKKPHLAIGMSVITLLCLFGMHIHEIIYYTIVRHLSTGLVICVTNFDTHFISIYNRVSTLIHYLLPFFIQIIAVTLLIILAARSRNKATSGNMTFGQVLIKQFRTQRELYITPIIIILSALPQTILTFSLACTQLTNWQRYALVISYLLSYTPQILGFILYVLPSTTYKKEFNETALAKNSLPWIFKKKKSKINVPKIKQ